ncbi:hypothetical protein [Oryzomicrobium sp.]|uniref:hypothetical protein n=1 Tax=Oryzomicrobium sp. TaxID=1911578 RepID=UPI002FE05434
MIVYHLWATCPSAAGCFLVDLGGFEGQLSITTAALQGTLGEFQRRGLVLLDEETGEAFILDWFRFHKFDTAPRRRLLEDAVSRIQSPKLRKLVLEKIEICLKTKGCDLREGKVREGNNHHSQSGVGGGVFQTFLNAAGAPDVLADPGLGKRLGKLIEGASQEQSKWAGLAWADQVAKGKIADPVALAITLTKTAARGEVTRPAPVLQQEAASATNEAIKRQERDRKEWAARQEEAIQKQVAAAGFSTSTKLRDRPYFRKSSHLTNT